MGGMTWRTMMHSHARCGACVHRDKTDVLFLTNRAMIHRRHGQVCSHNQPLLHTFSRPSLLLLR